MGKDFDYEKLKGNANYHIWQFATKNFLAFKGFDKCIQRVVKEATDTTPATSICAEEDASKCVKAKSLIVLSIESSLYVHINKCETALEFWECLQKLYEDK